MAQTATTLLTVLREGWTSDKAQQQFLADDTPLSRIEALQGTMIGKQAQTPVIADLPGGYTSTGAAGGAINTANNSVVNQAVWTLVQHLQPINLEISALNQGEQNMQALISAKSNEIRMGLMALRVQATRQLVTNGDGIVAQCASGGASTVVSLTASPSGTAYGFDAIRRRWLRPQSVVSVGTTANIRALASNQLVSAVAETAAAPTITIPTSITTVAGTHFVYIHNPNSTTAASAEVNGLRNMINTSGALGGLNPATAGQEFWQSAQRDTSTTVLSLDLILSLQTPVLQLSGKGFTDVWTSYKQQQNFYSLLQNQVRFPGELKMGAGDVGGVQWNNMTVNAYAAVLDSDWWCLTLSDLLRVTGSITKPTWMSEIGGAGQGATPQWHQGFTDFADALFYAFQIGMQRRNTSSGATALTA